MGGKSEGKQFSKSIKSTNYSHHRNERTIKLGYFNFKRYVCMFIERLLKGLHLMMPGLCRTDDPKAKASPRNGLKFSRDAGCATARC